MDVRADPTTVLSGATTARAAASYASLGLAPGKPLPGRAGSAAISNPSERGELVQNVPAMELPQRLPTRYTRLSPSQARLVLGALALGAAFFVGVSLSPFAQGRAGKGRRSPGDVALYRAEVERIAQGQHYYTAAAAELEARGYPTASIFNWRTPLPMWLIGRLGGIVFGRVVLGALALGLMLLAFEALAHEDPGAWLRGCGCALLLAGPLLFCVLDGLCVMPVLWAGVCIGLSCCAFGAQRRVWGVVFGLLALVMRDLALPYCLLGAIWAAWERRWGELTAWAAGLAGWGVWFAWHVSCVLPLIAPDAHGHAHGWLRFGGAGFVVATAQMHAVLLLVPQWITGLYLAGALLGLAGWDTPFGRRVGWTACFYLAAFAAVGNEFNQYWGCLIAPLLCFGVARAPASLVDLYRAALSRRFSTCRVLS